MPEDVLLGKDLFGGLFWEPLQLREDGMKGEFLHLRRQHRRQMLGRYRRFAQAYLRYHIHIVLSSFPHKRSCYSKRRRATSQKRRGGKESFSQSRHVQLLLGQGGSSRGGQIFHSLRLSLSSSQSLTRAKMDNSLLWMASPPPPPWPVLALPPPSEFSSAAPS